jgi:hypothetical protein
VVTSSATGKANTPYSGCWLWEWIYTAYISESLAISGAMRRYLLRISCTALWAYISEGVDRIKGGGLKVSQGLQGLHSQPSSFYPDLSAHFMV